MNKEFESQESKEKITPEEIKDHPKLAKFAFWAYDRGYSECHELDTDAIRKDKKAAFYHDSSEYSLDLFESENQQQSLEGVEELAKKYILEVMGSENAPNIVHEQEWIEEVTKHFNWLLSNLKESTIPSKQVIEETIKHFVINYDVWVSENPLVIPELLSKLTQPPKD